jgi:hypothetical protein
MNATFVELGPLQRVRSNYLDDAAFHALQDLLLSDPEAGDVIQGAGGLRKLRFGDGRRNKGRRGGLRVVYYWWKAGAQFWFFAIYDKNELADLTPLQRTFLKKLLHYERNTRH